MTSKERESMLYEPETALVYDGDLPGKHMGAMVPPLYQNNVFAFETLDLAEAAFADPAAFTYSRIRNPTVAFAEEKLAALAGGEKAKLFASGMGAISAAILHYLTPASHVVAVKNINFPIIKLFAYLEEKMGIQVSYVSGKDPEEFRSQAKSSTRLFYLESPTSGDFRVIDVRYITGIARKLGIKTILDNTWSTPLYQKPLALGVDVEVDSCSKYLGGHGDVICGAAIGNTHDIDTIAAHEYGNLGPKMAPGEAWLLLRSLRTLSIRMEKHQENAMAAAAFLREHREVQQVLYPGMPNDESYVLARSQMTGFSGRLAMILKTQNKNSIKRFIGALRFFRLGLSWGSCESQVYFPNAEDGSIRLSIGLEHKKDLIDDLAQALDSIT
jgi:cystathionine beta-lyase/cystathionine gamma-synthase